MDKSQTNALVRRYWLGLAGVAVVVLVAISAIGWALARTVTRPLRRWTPPRRASPPATSRRPSRTPPRRPRSPCSARP